MKRPNILVYEEVSAYSSAIRGALDRADFNAIYAQDRGELLSLLRTAPANAVVLGPSAVDSEYTLHLAVQIRQLLVAVPLVLIVAKSCEELAIAALRAGITEYLKSPYSPDELVTALGRCLATRRDNDHCDTAVGLGGVDHFVGDSTPMRDVRARLAKAAATDSNVLVTGETGTGKELAAELVHRNSGRCKKSFVTINCAAIPDSLLESELFGFDRGAFTGAVQSREGKLAAANGGTVFLDEIGDMSLYGQAKMLRMIESHEIQRLGRNSANVVNIRVIAATNRELERLVADGSFRKDLFFRLAVTCIHVPPLRERKEDLLALLTYYIGYFNHRFGRSVRRLSDEAMELLLAYSWPGNVRELKNLLEAIFVDLPSPDTEVAELPSQFRSRYADFQFASGDERARLVWALSATNWNKSKAASSLHWSRMTLYRKMARYHIKPADRD